MTDWSAEAQVHVIVDTGQLTANDRKKLDALIRTGEIDKWRGHWFPIPGAAQGIGPLKTCYGPKGSKP